MSVFFSICSLLLLSLADTTFWLFVFSCMSFSLFYLLSLCIFSVCLVLFVTFCKCVFLCLSFLFSITFFVFSICSIWCVVHFSSLFVFELIYFLSVCLYLKCLHRFVCFSPLIYFLSVYLSCLLHNFCLFVFLYLYGLMRGSFIRFVCLSTEAKPTNPT